MQKLMLFFLLVITAAVSIQAQQPSSDAPRFTPEQIAQRRKLVEEKMRTDWAFLKRYQQDNIKIQNEKNPTDRVVFIGDSITENWWKFDSAFWKDNLFIDRGIGGQTSGQLLLRFRQDVVELKPNLVVINAGINDIAEATGPTTLLTILGNIKSMVEVAEANHIRVILTAVLPASYFKYIPGIEPADKVVELNELIKTYAASKAIPYVDYWKPLADDLNGLDTKFTYDGVHPNLDGYRIMETLVVNKIKQVMKKR